VSLTQTELPQSRAMARQYRRRFERAAQIGWTRRLLVFGALVMWELLARLAGNSELIAPPSSIVRALFSDILSDSAIRGAIALTLFEVVCAYALAVVVGLAMGLAIGSTNLSRRSLFPIILLLYAIPQVILLPLFTLGFGIGPAAKIAFGFSHGIFPVIVNTIAGMRNVSPLLVGGAAAMGATRAQQIRYVIFPHMVGTVFAGLRLAMTLTLLGVVLAEIFVSQGGIGFYTLAYSETFNPAALMALVLTLALMAIALNELVRLVEGRFSRWKE